MGAALDGLIGESRRLTRTGPPGPSCRRCRTEIIHDTCECGSSFDRFTALLQESMSDENQALDAAATRYLRGDDAAWPQLKASLEDWLDCRRARGL